MPMKNWIRVLVFTSQKGDVFFNIVPPKVDAQNQVVREPFGIAYRLTEEGTLTELYRARGWYSFQVFISNDGRSAVQMGPWNRGHQLDASHLALAFHRDGKLIRRYSTADLVRSPERLHFSKSHYQWLAETPAKFGWSNQFELTTCDDLTYSFDVTTGEIKSTIVAKSRPGNATGGNRVCP